MCSIAVARPPFFREVCIRAKGGNGERSRETLCYDIYPARPISTVFLAANTYCVMDGRFRAPGAVGHGSNLAAPVNGAINDRREHTAG